MSTPTLCTRHLFRSIKSQAIGTQSGLLLLSRHVIRHHRLQPGPQARNASTTRKPPPPPPQAHQFQRQPPPQSSSPSPQAQSQSQRQQPLQPMQPGNDPTSKSRGKFAPILLSFIAVGLGFYITQLAIVARRPCAHPNIQSLSQQKDVAARYDDTADGFDSEVGFSEALMGINSIRKSLSRQCKGDVLEVSCGTGRNLGYYDLQAPGSAVRSLTFLDLSSQMVAVCKKKWTALYPASTPTSKQNHNFAPDLAVRFSVASALDPMPPAPTTTPESNGKYTTILQTMGLCSTPTPHELLLNIAAHLDVSDPDARILLLEHGRSDHAWLNNILDNSAAKHAEIHGCWFNRDIGEVVAGAAAASGLEIVRERRKHFGTTWEFELKASEKTRIAGGGATAGASRTAADADAGAEGASVSAGWRGWLGLK